MTLETWSNRLLSGLFFLGVAAAGASAAETENVAPAASAAAVRKSARSVASVLQDARLRDKVLIEGKVTRAFNFDDFLLTDDKSQIAVTFAGVRQNIHAGDRIAVYGRFGGRYSYLTRYGLLSAVEWARLDDSHAAELLEKYGVDASSPTVSPAIKTEPAASAPPTAARSVESRLKDLEDLKTKNLVSPDEYKAQRERILNDL